MHEQMLQYIIWKKSEICVWHVFNTNTLHKGLEIRGALLLGPRSFPNFWASKISCAPEGEILASSALGERGDTKYTTFLQGSVDAIKIGDCSQNRSAGKVMKAPRWLYFLSGGSYIVQISYLNFKRSKFSSFRQFSHEKSAIEEQRLPSN